MLEKRGAVMEPPRAPSSPVADAEHKSLPQVLKEHSSEIVNQWAAEAARIPFTKAADFAVPLDARVDRMRAYLDAIIERSEHPDSKKAHEILRSTIRTEHVRSVNLSSVIRNQHILRDLMYGVIERAMPEHLWDCSKTSVDAMIDRSVEEIVLLLEDFTETQGVLLRCLSCAPTDPYELDHILTRFCRSTMEYFDADFVALFKVLEDSRELMCTSSAAKGMTLSKDKRTLFDAFPLAAEAIAQRRTKTCDAPAIAGQRRRVLGQFAFDHCVVIPMESKERVIGLFFMADSSRLTQYTADETSLAEELATNVVKIIESAESFELLSLRSRAQKALIDTAVSLQREIESQEIYRIVANKISELIPNNELVIYAFDWDRHVGNPVYATGPYADEAMEDRNFSADVGICGHVARTKKGEIILDSEADPRGESIPGTPATHSRMLAVPLIGRKDVLGVVELIKYPPETFTNEDLEIATMFANHAAVAIENASLLKEVLGARDQVELHMDLMMHDIANYTTPITAYADEMLRRKDLSPEAIDKVGKALGQIKNITVLIDMVRTMARLRENEITIFENKDLKAAIDQAIDDVKKSNLGKDVQIEVDLPSGQPRVVADDMLKEIFRNLFYTAVRSDKRDSVKLRITAEVRREAKRELWWIKIFQPNKSIPDHLKTEVLRFAKASKSELAGGFGIGLATSRGIVERYLGRMWVTDIVPGDPSKGCVFNIALPRAT
jgi:GAF domain-containing protein